MHRRHTRADEIRFQSGSFWEERANVVYGYLLDEIGESQADQWIQGQFPDGQEYTWKAFALLLDGKLAEVKSGEGGIKYETGS